MSDLLEVLEKYGVRSAADLEEQLSARFEVVESVPGTIDLSAGIEQGPQWEVVDVSQPEVVEALDQERCHEERLIRVSGLILVAIRNLCKLARIPRNNWGKYFEQVWPPIIEDQAKWNVADVEERFAVVYRQETASQVN